MSDRISRRTFVAGGLAAATGFVASPSLIRSAYGQEAVNLHSVLSMSGSFASVAKLLNEGTELAVQTLSTPAYKFRNVVVDDQGDAGRAVRRVRELVDNERQSFFINGTISSISLAVARELGEKKALYINSSGADEMTGAQCNRTTFRWNSTSHSMLALTTKGIAAAIPRAKRCYTVTAQYVFGENMLNNARRMLPAHGIEHVGNTFHSLTEREFSGYFPAIMAARPDVLLLANFGPQTTDFVRQAVSFGLKNRMQIVVAWSTGLDQLQALGPEISENIYFATPYWHTIDTPENNRYVAASRKMFNETPTYSAAAAYFTTKLLIDGVTKANSLDVMKIVEALEGHEFKGASGVEIVRKEDHQVVKDGYFMKGKSKAAMKDKDDFLELLSTGRDFIPVDQAGCRMA